MKKAVYYDTNHFEFEDIGELQIGSQEVLLKLGACGLCGTDIHKAMHNTVKSPLVLGHEVAGTIVEIGDEITDYKVGDRVYLAHHVPCFTCKHCKRGHYSLCAQFKATNIDPGGFSEYIRVPELNVKHTMGKLPEDMSFEIGAMVEPIACCLHGFNAIEMHPGDNVLIMGAGQIGNLQVQLAKHFLADKVIVSDINDYRLDKALEMGADGAIRPDKENTQERIEALTNGEGVDIIIISSGIGSLLTEAMDIISPGGTILVFAPFRDEPVLIPASRFFEEEIKVVGSYSSTPYNYTPALELLKKGVIQVDKMTTHRFPLSQLKEAIHLASDTSKEVLKVMMVPDEK